MPRRVELLVGAAGAAYGAATAALAGATPWVVAASGVLGATLGAGRRHPRIAWPAAAAATLAMVPEGVPPDPVYLLVLAHVFGAGRWDERWSGVAALVLMVGLLELGVAVGRAEAVPYLFIPVAAWGAGRALGERERLAERLAERARELESERDAHAALSVRYERARIASELHDIVAHAISVMVVQASAGQRLAAHDPQLTAEAFAAIAEAARQAEHDMGRLVALLGDEEAIGAAPDLTLVEELVARAAGSGLDVTLRLEGERNGLPVTVVRTAYRVVQEGLTNALRYASGASVTVLVDGRGDALVVEVANGPATRAAELAASGTGNGLRGLRERVDACGGRLDAGPTPGGGWALSARLARRPSRAGADRHVARQRCAAGEREP